MKKNNKNSFAGIAFMLAASLLGGYLLNDEASHETGEENLSNAVALQDVPRIGDTRLKKVVARLRQGALGEELYNHALENNVDIIWENEDNAAAGSYNAETRLLTLDTRNSDAQLISVLAHELRHHWQYTATDINQLTLDPLRAWQTARLVEVDACAFTAKFITDYNENSAKKLDLSNKFGSKALAHYSAVPAGKRDYLQDAVLPCFKEIAGNDTYNDNHIGFTNTVASIYEEKYRISVQSKNYEILLGELAQMPNHTTVKHHFSQLLTSSLDPAKPEAAIQNATPEEFANWLQKMTKNEHSKEVMRHQRKFMDNHMNILERAHQDLGRPAPSPSS